LSAPRYTSTQLTRQKKKPYDSIELFTRVLEMVRKDYVDGENLTYQDLVYAALKGMISTLIPTASSWSPQI
jgi:hypothetical protein